MRVRARREDMRREVPFQPESVLHELYSLEQIVSSIAAGSWAAGGGGGPGGGGDAPAARFSADDAAAGFHEWQDHSGAGLPCRLAASAGCLCWLPVLHAL